MEPHLKGNLSIPLSHNYNQTCINPQSGDLKEVIHLINPFNYMNPNYTLLEHLGGFIYFVNPRASMFDRATDVPDYIIDVMPVFVTILFMEMGILWLMGRRIYMPDYLCSGGIGVIHLATNFILYGYLLKTYEWLYQFRLWDIPGNSIYTWLVTLLLVDFMFYWSHRAHHELNILWMFHQVHHSAEDYNLAVPLRLPILLKVTYFCLYVPLAFIGIPLASAVVHSTLNLLFDFWLHTKLIPHLGPFELIFNSPSSHRVHHGTNEWCLDKNYGSVFIIWDKIFGTYQAERSDEEIVFGLTTQTMSQNALWHQTYYFRELYRKITSMDTWENRLKAAFYGPGWTPGAPRLGDPTTMIPVPVPRAPYDPFLPKWQMYYIMVHVFIGAIASQMLDKEVEAENWWSVARILFFIMISMGIVTSMYDNWQWSTVAEAIRCSLFVAYANYTSVTGVPFLDAWVSVFFATCSLLWISRSLVVSDGCQKIKTK